METNIDEKVNSVHHERAPSINNLDKSTTIDTVHNDEAVKVLAQYAGDESWTEQEEKKLRMKIDRRLLSILCITYGLQYYDKAMLAQAVRSILVSIHLSRHPTELDRLFLDFGLIWALRREIDTVSPPLSSTWGSSVAPTQQS